MLLRRLYNNLYRTYVKPGARFRHIPSGVFLEILSVRRKYILFGPKIVNVYLGRSGRFSNMSMDDFLDQDIEPITQLSNRHAQISYRH
jgi:hypothetical protein